MKRGIDGWRLDVPNDIDDDSFWQEFRHRIKAINPDAYIVGEIWDEPSRWLQGDQFDGVMNYPLRKAVLAYLFDEKPIDMAEFAKRLQDAFPEGRFGVQMNLLGSHDTIRLASLPCSNLQRVELALTLLFFLPGAPCIYYGDEIGMLGGKDPDNRRSFPWDKFPEMQKAPVYDYLKSLIALRNKERVLREGSLEIAYRAGRLEIIRTLGKKKMTLVVSTAKTDPLFEIK
jgi:glycosidase